MSDVEFARIIIVFMCLGVVFTITHYWVLEVWFDLFYHRFDLNYLSYDDRCQLMEAACLKIEQEYDEWRMSSESSDHLGKVAKDMQGEPFHKGYGL